MISMLALTTALFTHALAAELGRETTEVAPVENDLEFCCVAPELADVEALVTSGAVVEAVEGAIGGLQ